MDRGHIFIVSAPAGTGKTTLVARLEEELPEVARCITCTTRKPRHNEIDGVHYRFLSEDTFVERIEQGLFFEHVSLFGNRYGTAKADLHSLLEQGYSVVLVIDTQGALAIETELPLTRIFITPPSLDELRKRLEERKTESKETLNRRLQEAEKELACAEQYDYCIVNDDIEAAYQAMRELVLSVRDKNKIP